MSEPPGMVRKRSRERLPAFLEQLAGYRVRADRPLIAADHGERRARATGAGFDIQDIRHYAPGDDLRYLDWNAYGRLGQLYLKRFEATSDLTLSLVLDTTPSMVEPSSSAADRTPDKLSFARDLALGLGHAALRNGDRVRVLRMPRATPGDSFRVRGRDRLGALASHLAAIEPQPIAAHRASLRPDFEPARRSDVCVILADLQEPEAWLPFARFLSRRTLATYLIHLVHPQELNPALPAGGELELQDIERGPAHRTRLPWDRGVLGIYREELSAHFAHVASEATRAGATYIRLTTDGAPTPALWRRLAAAGLLRLV